MKTLLLATSLLALVGCATNYPKVDTACVAFAHKLNEDRVTNKMTESHIQSRCAMSPPTSALSNSQQFPGNTGLPVVIIPAGPINH